MALARMSKALKASKTQSVLMLPVHPYYLKIRQTGQSHWKISHQTIEGKLFGFRSFTQLLISACEWFIFFVCFSERFPLENPDDDFIDKNPRKTQVAFPRGFTACVDCGHLSQRATHSQHVEENLPFLQKPLTRCGVVGERNDPQSSCLCQENFCCENARKNQSFEITKYRRVETSFLWKQLVFWYFVHIYCTADVSIIISVRNVGIHAYVHNRLLCLSSQTNIKATRHFHCVVTERARGACNDMDRIMHNSFMCAPYTAHKAQMWVMVAFVYREIMFLLATPYNPNQLWNQNTRN